jgi:hypothetical protein
MMTIKNTRSPRGFTLLLATITSTLLLILGSTVFNIIQKEIVLSSLGRDSQFAFYTADAGAECALYWDMRHSLFSTTTLAVGSATCDTTDILPQLTQPSGGVFPGYGIPMEFEYEPGNLCVRVSVTKYDDATRGADDPPTTLIDARGYNVACGAVQSSARALERAVQIRY